MCHKLQSKFLIQTELDAHMCPHHRGHSDVALKAALVQKPNANWCSSLPLCPSTLGDGHLRRIGSYASGGLPRYYAGQSQQA